MTSKKGKCEGNGNGNGKCKGNGDGNDLWTGKRLG